MATTTSQTLTLHPRIAYDRAALGALCRRWNIIRFEFFGSVLRDDFGPDSDVDCLVTFSNPEEVGLFEHMQIEEELSAVLGHPVRYTQRSVVERDVQVARRCRILEEATGVRID